MTKPDVPNNSPAVHKLCVDDYIVRLDEHVGVVKRTNEAVTGLSESDRDGTRASADLAPDGTVNQQLIGKSPQGERDTMSAARILLQRLNTDGASWGEPHAYEPPADVGAVDTRDSSRELRIQVTRAVGNPDLWRRLGNQGNVSRDWSTAEIVSEVRDAIHRKGASKYSTVEAHRLVLALDANRLPALVIDQVRSTIIHELGAIADATPYAAIWIVGPMPDLCYRITQVSSPVSPVADGFQAGGPEKSA